MRGGYDRVEGSIGKSYDEIKGVTMSMSMDFYMLGKIATGKKVDISHTDIITSFSLYYRRKCVTYLD